jgi:Leucine Rich repeat
VLRLNGNSQQLFNQRITHMQMLALCDVLAHDTRIEYLDLSFNDATPAHRHGETDAATFGDWGAIAVARLLRTNVTLKYIMLEGNAITKDGASELARSIAKADMSCLAVLNLAANPIGDQVRFPAIQISHSNPPYR